MNFCVVLVFCPSKSVGVPWRSGGGGRFGPTSTLDAVTYPLSISVEEGLAGDASGPEIVVLRSSSRVLTKTILLYFYIFVYFHGKWTQVWILKQIFH